MKSIRTYILIADEKEARLLENTGIGKGIHQVSYHQLKIMAWYQQNLRENAGPLEAQVVKHTMALNQKHRSEIMHEICLLPI